MAALPSDPANAYPRPLPAAGKTAPALQGFDRRGLIAGKLPNRPEVLAEFVRNAPALVADTTMPPMPLSANEALDVTAYLYEIGR